MMMVTLKGTLIGMIFMVLTGIFFLKSFLYKIQNIANTIININNKFSQNLVDRLIAIKLIRM